jgi:predicted transcriptional regulator
LTVVSGYFILRRFPLCPELEIKIDATHPSENSFARFQTVWVQSHQTVNEVEERLRNKREIAHTTVLTTLDRMHRKGYLTREKQAKAFVYAPRYTRDEFERMLAQEVLGALIGHFTEPALSTFVDLVSDEPGALDQLEEKIRAKRRERSEK